MTRKLPPRRRPTEFSHVTVCDAVQKRLIAQYHHLGSWKRVGAEIGVTPAMAQRVAKTDYRPVDNAIRERLGLPILKPAPVCVTCGEVHTLKSCPAARKPKKPRTGLTPRQKRWLAILGILYGGDGKVIK